MTSSRALSTLVRGAAISGLLLVAACGENAQPGPTPSQKLQGRTTIWDMVGHRDDGTRIAVNRYLWQASQDVLSFMPIKEVDPFSGVIVFGVGTPPGGHTAYQATVYIKDPALEARSLNLSLQTANGHAVSEATQRAVEDAILTRARQLLAEDSKR